MLFPACFFFFHLTKIQPSWSGKMAECMKVIATNPEDLCSTPVIHVVGRQN